MPDNLSCNATESATATSSTASSSGTGTGTGTETGTNTGQNTATTSGGDNGDNRKKKDHSLAIGLGVGLGVGIPLTLGVIGFFLVYVWRTKRKDEKAKATSDESNPSGNAESGAGDGKTDSTPVMGSFSRTEKTELPADTPGPRHELAGDERFQGDWRDQERSHNELAADKIPRKELPGDEHFRRELA